MKKNTVRTLSRAVDNIVLLTLLVCLIIACWSFYDSRSVYAAASADKYETYKPSVDNTKSFEELQAMNSDVIGWLTIYGTSIDYPIVKAQKDNWEYLSKNAEGEWEASGALFVDYRNGSHFEDFNTIIHGHHMAEHAMFGDLDLFKDQTYFNEHQYANLYFDGANHGLEIFSILTIDAYNPIAADANIQGVESQQALLDRIKANQVFGRDISVTVNDHIVIMTTCNLGETNGRYTLAAKLLDHEVVNPFPEEENTNRGDRIDIFSWLSNFAKLPILAWFLILIALIILTYILYKAELKRLKKKQEKKQ